MNATVNGLNIHYDIRGDGPAVLLIHGFPLSNALWAPLADRIGDAYQLIMPDLRGLGRSEVGVTASMEDFADDLAKLLDCVGLDRAVIAGLSMGGYVAMEFYRRFPDRASALILVDTRAEADAPDAAEDRRRLADRVMQEGSTIVADAMVEKLFAPDAPKALKQQWRDIMAASPPAGVAAALRGMADRPDSFDTLRSVDKPSLVVVGDADVITPPSAARAMHESLEQGELKTIADAGHMPPVEKPDRFAFVMREFLDRLK